MVFEQDDDGKFIQVLTEKEKVVLTATKDDSRLYNLDLVHTDTMYHAAPSDSTSLPIHAKLHRLHCAIGHLSYDGCCTLYRAGGLEDCWKFMEAELKAEPPVCDACT